MPEPEKTIELGLNSGAKPPDPQNEFIPPPESLQFRKAERAEEPSNGPRCTICSKPIVDTYYHAQGQVVCPACAKAVEAGQNAAPAHTLLKSFIYGLGAAIAGTALFSIVWIVTNYQLALIAILIGYMVGKAVRHASKGLGGRPQQILAVLLTYFSITTSYIPVAVYHYSQNPKAAVAAQAAASNQPDQVGGKIAKDPAGPTSLPGIVLALLMLAVAAPFLSLNQGLGGILTLLIVFWGLQRAWRLTGRSNILVMGPYEVGS